VSRLQWCDFLLVIILTFWICLLCTSCSTGPGAALVTSVAAEEVDASPVAARPYRRAITREARAAFGLNAPVPVLAAQIEQESAWNERAVSYVGAAGLCQAMPATARQYGADPYQPDACLRLQSQMMRDLFVSMSGGSEPDRVAFALSAYNGGGLWVKRDRALAAASGADDQRYAAVAPFNAGRRPSAFAENRGYVPAIVKRQPHYQSWGRWIDFSGVA
jgi:soluble lytic murein transglycosylase-like protein